MVEGGGSRDGGGAGPAQSFDDLDDLRAELVRFVLREAGQAIARDPDLPLSAALTRAIESEARRGAERNKALQPTPEALADGVMAALRPQLAEVVRSTAGREADNPYRGARMGALSLPIVTAIAVALAVLGFACGFVTHRLLTPAPAATAVQPDPPPLVAPTEENQLPPVDPNGASSPTPNGAPAQPTP